MQSGHQPIRALETNPEKYWLPTSQYRYSVRCYMGWVVLAAARQQMDYTPGFAGTWVKLIALAFGHATATQQFFREAVLDVLQVAQLPWKWKAMKLKSPSQPSFVALFKLATAQAYPHHYACNAKLRLWCPFLQLSPKLRHLAAPWEPVDQKCAADTSLLQNTYAKSPTNWSAWSGTRDAAPPDTWRSYWRSLQVVATLDRGAAKLGIWSIAVVTAR